MSEPVRDAWHNASSTDAQPRVGVAERTHATVREQLSQAIEAGLPPEEVRGMEAHLAACRPCAAFRRTLVRTMRLLQALPTVKAPEESKRRVLDALP